MFFKKCYHYILIALFNCTSQVMTVERVTLEEKKLIFSVHVVEISAEIHDALFILNFQL